LEEKREHPIDYGLLNTSAELDFTVMQFQNTIRAIIILASTETSILRLVTELNKVQRRINALEKVFIPKYKKTIKKIGFILEEKERDFVSLIKILKERFSKEKILNAETTL
ncbi:MAG: V-type ATP synthase subunit D, partial [Candidatus Helarchaeota archaeon]